MTIDLGAGPVSIRWTSDIVGAWVRELFHPYVLGAESGRFVYSIDSPSAHQYSRVRKLGVLYGNGATLVRSLNVGRLLRVLAAYVSAEVEAMEAFLRYDGVAVVRDGSAAVLPRRAHTILVKHERALRRVGYGVVNRPWVLLDPRTREVVVPKPVLTGPAMRLGEVTASQRTEIEVPSGRYPLSNWIVEFDGSTQGGSARSAVMAAIGGWMDCRREPLGVGLEDLAQLVCGAERFTIDLRAPSTAIRDLQRIGEG